MSDHDLLVHGANISLAVSGGVITASGPSISGTADEEIDFADALILPGWIDAHVHFNEPGRADWEGFTTGSRALAAECFGKAIHRIAAEHGLRCRRPPSRAQVRGFSSGGWRRAICC